MHQVRPKSLSRKSRAKVPKNWAPQRNCRNQKNLISRVQAAALLYNLMQTKVQRNGRKECKRRSSDSARYSKWGNFLITKKKSKSICVQFIVSVAHEAISTLHHTYSSLLGNRLFVYVPACLPSLLLTPTTKNF